jgi:dolichyl-phosphooligosaccharide-protein glycotransferase
MSVPSSGWWSRHGWTVAILVSAFGLAFAIRTIWLYPLIQQYGPLFSYGGGSDSYYHSRVTTYIILTHTNLIHDPLLRFPLGSTNPREPLFDWSNAILGLVFAPFFGGNAVVAGAWFLDLSGPLWAALEVFPIYLIGREVSGRRMGLVAALIFPFLSASIDSSVFGYANYLAYYTFVILVVIYGYLRTVKAVGSRRWVENYRDLRSVFAGLKAFLSTERTGVKWAVFTGVALGAMALSWQGWTYAVVVIGASLLVTMFVERVRRIDSFGLYIGAWLVGLVAFPMAFPYYYVQTEVTKIMGPAIVVYFGVLLLLLPFLFLRDVPWVFSVPLLIGVVGAAVLGLRIIFPSYFTLLVTGQGYFVKTLIYSTIAEAQPPSFDQLVVGYGVFTFFLAFVGLALFGFLTARYKFRRWHVVFLVYGIISVYLPTTATKFFLVATPAFALLAAEALHRVLDVAKFPEFRRTVASLSDRGSQFSAFRKAFRPRHVLILALAVVVLLPNVWVGIDAGIPSNTKDQFAAQINHTIPSWLKLNSSAPGSDYLGAAGAGLDLSNEYDSAAYSWLATQDTNVPEPNRPAFIDWWDYGFQAIDQGEHPSVADNFQHGIDPSGQFLLAQNESIAIAVLATTLLQAEAEVTHQPDLPAALNTILAQDGVNTTVLHSLMTNENNDYTQVVDHPEKYLPVNPSTLTDDNAMYLTVSYFLAGTLSLSEVAAVYDAIQMYTGWSIRYAGADTRLFPFSGDDTGIYYAPADLTGRVIDSAGIPTSYFTVNETGSNGVSYPLGSAPANVTAVNYTIDYSSAFYNSMIYRIYVGYNGTDIGQTAGIPGLSGSVEDASAEPGWMLQHFEAVYRTAYVCPGAVNATPGTSCFVPTNLPDAKSIAKATNGTADISSTSYYEAGQAILAYYPGQTLLGTITLDNGAPVAGVNVTVQDGWGIPHMVATTAADGTFTLVLPPGNDTLVVSAGKVSGVNQTGPTIVRTIKLNVSDANAYSLNPPSLVETFSVPNATVQGVVFRSTSNNSTYTSSDAIVPGAHVALTSLGGGATLTAVTDASGSYVIANVPPGPYGVSATYGGETYNGSNVTLGGGTTPVNVSVPVPTTALAGLVADSAGTAYADAIVTISNASGVIDTTVTDAGGAYSFEGVPAGTYLLKAVVNATLRSPGIPLFVPTTGGSETENLTVTSLDTATVTVEDRGVPAAGVPVVFLPAPVMSSSGAGLLAALEGSSTNTTLATTNSEGTVTTTLAPGTYSAYVLTTVGGRSVAGLGTVLVPATGVPASAEISLGPALTLSGALTGVPSANESSSAVLATSASGAQMIAWGNVTAGFSLRLPAGNYTVLGAAGAISNTSGTYAGFGTVRLGASTTLDVVASLSVDAVFTVGATLSDGQFFPAAGANVTVSLGGSGPAFTARAADNGSVAFDLPSSVPLSSGGYCVQASAFGFTGASDCGLSASSIASLSQFPLTLNMVPVLLTVDGLPSGTPVTVNLTAESASAVNRTLNGGPTFSLTLPPGTYGVGASAVIGNGTRIYLPPSIETTVIPLGATQSNLTLTVVPEINATGILSLPTGYKDANVSISLVAAGLEFEANGSQFVRTHYSATNTTVALRIAPGTYTATATATGPGGTLVNVTRVTAYANGTIRPKLVLNRGGVVLNGTLTASNSAVVAANTTVTLVGADNVNVEATSASGKFSLTLPPGGTYSVYANATLPTNGPNGTFNQTWSTSPGDACTVSASSPNCSVPMVGEVQLVTLKGTLVDAGTQTTLAGTVRLVGPYPDTFVTTLSSANGTFQGQILPGAYYVYASANGTLAATFARLIALPPKTSTLTLELEPGWVDTVSILPPTTGETIGPANVTVEDAFGNRTTFSGVVTGSPISIVLPTGEYSIRATASGTLNGVAGNASGNATARVVSGNVGTSLALTVPVSRTVSASLVGPTSATVSSGGTATFSFSVRDSGNAPVTVTPVGSPAFWAFDFSWSSANLTPGGGSVAGEVTIHVPRATSVSHVPVAISFDLANGTSAGSVTPAPTVAVVAYYGVALTSEPTTVLVGETSVSAPFTVSNTGNAPENVSVSVSDGLRLASLGWTVSLVEDGTAVTAPLSLTAGENVSLDVNLSVNGTAFVPPGTVTVSGTVVTAGGGNTSTLTMKIPKATVGAQKGISTVTGPGITSTPALPDWVVPLVAFVPAIALAVGVVTYRWWRTRRWRRR